MPGRGEGGVRKDWREEFTNHGSGFPATGPESRNRRGDAPKLYGAGGVPSMYVYECDSRSDYRERYNPSGRSPIPVMSEPRVCLITGASRGIGRATAVALTAAGWRLSLAARSKDPLVELVRETDCEHLATICDVTDEADVQKVVRATVDELGRLDAIVCAAGIGSFGPTAGVSLDDWNAQIAANLTGTFLVCREALKVMLPQKRGHLVNILSVASKVVFPYSAAYVASKWGAYGLTKSLAEEVRREGVRVTAILPGSVDTPFWDANPGGPPRADMLKPEAVAEAVRYALDAPESASVDEIHLMPPKGIL